jgi:hypothetical protein
MRNGFFTGLAFVIVCIVFIVGQSVQADFKSHWIWCGAGEGASPPEARFVRDSVAAT